MTPEPLASGPGPVYGYAFCLDDGVIGFRPWNGPLAEIGGGYTPGQRFRVEIDPLPGPAQIVQFELRLLVDGQQRYTTALFLDQSYLGNGDGRVSPHFVDVHLQDPGASISDVVVTSGL